MDRKKHITRRDFLRNSAGATLAGVAGMTTSAHAAAGADDKTQRAKVILIRDENVLNDNRKPNADILQKMLDDAVKTLLDETDTTTAWKRLVKEEDVVGIKSNVWHYLPTPSELEAAIKRRCMDVGVSEDRIGIDDRGVLGNPIFQKATALINTRPMRTHDWSGVGSCIKNYIMFSPRPPKWHPDTCANLAGLWDLPMVKGKTRLNVLVMLTPLFHGKGPHHYHPQYTWEYKGLVVGRDPVAVDSTGVRILEAKRKEYFDDQWAFPKSPKHIRVAEEKFGLGVADPDRIDLVKLGWKQEILI